MNLHLFELNLWSSYLATVSPELELANGIVCKTCFSKLEKAGTYFATVLDLVLDCLRHAIRRSSLAS